MGKMVNITNVLKLEMRKILFPSLSSSSSRNYDLIIIKLGMILHHKKINNNFLILERRFGIHNSRAVFAFWGGCWGNYSPASWWKEIIGTSGKVSWSYSLINKNLMKEKKTEEKKKIKIIILHENVSLLRVLADGKRKKRGRENDKDQDNRILFHPSPKMKEATKKKRAKL